ncbi:MAG: ATP-binding protein [Thermodesulfobacteriota bacterium]
MKNIQKKRPGYLLVLSFALCAVFFVIDIKIPLGVAAGVPYVAVMLITIWLPQRRSTLFFAVLCTLLTILGYVISPVGGEHWKVLANRSLALFAIWVTAGIGFSWKKGEEEIRKLSLAVEQSPAAVIITDTEGIIEYVNPKFTEVTGYFSKEAIGQKPNIVKSGKMQDSVYKELWETIKEGKEWRGEMTNKKKDGTFFEESLVITPMRDEGGIVTHYLGIKEDITEENLMKKEQELMMREAERMMREQVDLVDKLEHSNQELKDFAYIVSHDLKAPLRAIGSLSDWIATDYADKFDEDGREQMELLRSRVRRMHGLIEGVLTYSKVGREAETITEVDLAKTVEDAIDFVGVPDRIKVTVEGEFPILACDEIRIEQVFQNLLSNAIKYMDKDEGFITVSCVDQGLDWQFNVKDNGPGIEEQYFKKIFQIFQTLSPRDEVEGTGIGLSVIKKIVEMYGGTIWVKSTPGEGSTFSFTLPKDRSYS